MKALILSGGTGTRLRPLTFTHAKQLLPVANKPTLFYIIEKVVKAGIQQIGIVVGDTHEEIQQAVGNGERWNADITYIRQLHPQGLAHAVKTASGFIGDSDFLMILGDNLFHMELDSLIQGFYKESANASILLHRVQNPSQFGVAVVKNGKIEKLVEKPQVFISDLIITGVYIFDKSIFACIDEIKPSPRGELEITDAIQKLLEEGGKITYTTTNGWWKDTGKLPDLLEANQLVLDDTTANVQGTIDTASILRGKVSIASTAKVQNSIIHGPAAIAENTVIINSYIGPYTSVSSDVTIVNSEIENSIVLNETKLENISKRIHNSLIGRNVSIKGSENQSCSACFLIGDQSEIVL